MRPVQFRQLAGFLLIISLLGVSIASQLKHTIYPFSKSYKQMPYMLAKDDLGQLKELAYPYYQLINEINKSPQETNFYFPPAFGEWKNQGVWQWYIYVLARYLSYPRKVFSLHTTLYHNSRSEYFANFIRGSKYYSQLEWLKVRNISYVVLFSNAQVSILPISAEIAGE